MALYSSLKAIGIAALALLAPPAAAQTERIVNRQLRQTVVHDVA